jgi:hypothetical protein
MSLCHAVIGVRLKPDPGEEYELLSTRETHFSTMKDDRLDLSAHDLSLFDNLIGVVQSTQGWVWTEFAQTGTYYDLRFLVSKALLSLKNLLACAG